MRRSTPGPRPMANPGYGTRPDRAEPRPTPSHAQEPQRGMGRMDAFYFILVLLLVCYGLVMLMSASMTVGASGKATPFAYFSRQALFTGAGFALAILLSVFNLKRRFDKPRLAVFLYLGSLALLFLVLVPGIGVVRGGARRWFELGPIQVQPTEIAKVALVFCLAVYYSWLGRRKNSGHFERKPPMARFLLETWFEFLLPVLLTLVMVVPVILEPHFSGTVILVLLCGAVVLSAGIRLRSAVAGTAAILVLLLLLGGVAMAAAPMLPPSAQKYFNWEYAQKRIDTFLDPETVDEDQSLQTRQSIQAIGAGGLTGVGLGLGRQKYGYLPMSYNDYIFSIVAEELGFLGASAVLLLFLLLLFRGVSLAARAPTPFGATLVAGYTFLLVIQALLNIGVATNSIPPTGISLPFFSYGGSSNILFLLAVGVVLSVSRTIQARPASGGREEGA